jgi:hypothetical protein
MSTPTKLGLFGAALVAIFGVAAVVGNLAGPEPTAAEAETATATEGTVPVGEGVVAATDGYRLVPASSALAPDGGELRFHIEGPDRDPVTQFVPTHERRLHLVVVNRELTSYHHLHPVLGDDGIWTVQTPAVPAGSYRAIADFQVADGPALALGVDLHMAGDYRPTRPGEPGHTARVDGYEVHLETEPGVGGEVEVAMTVRKDGEVVGVQPYLGASGHLVALRSGDLLYAHVHPLGDADGTVRFAATLPSAGSYRLFFDFKHDDQVHTAAFTFDQSHVSSGHSMEH